MQRRGAVLAAIVSAACFGTMAIVVRAMYEQGAEPLQVLAWRFGVAAVLMGGYTAMKRPASLMVGRRDLARFVRLSVLGYGAASLCFFFALQYAPASIVAILLYTYPAIVVIGETLFAGAAVTGSRVGSVLLTFLGCVLVVNPFGGGLSVRPLGIALGLGAGLAYASFSMLSHDLMRTRSRSVIMTYLFIFTAAFATIVAIVSGSTLSPATWSSSTWALLGVLVLVPTFFAIVLYLNAVRTLGASQAAILSTFEPVFTLVLAFLILQEALEPIQVVGAALVLAGVVMAEFAASRLKEPAAV